VSQRLAALDLGSNSFHLLVAERVHGGRIRRVTTRKITLRLAEPVARDGNLGKPLRTRAAAAVADLLQHAVDHRAEMVVTLATEALRHAGDGPKLLEALARDQGLAVRIIAGLDEAALSLRAMVEALALEDGQRLLGFDLGGGSLEAAYGTRDGMRDGISLPLGSARLRTRFDHDPLWLSERGDLRAEALALLAPLVEKVRTDEDLSSGRARLRAAGTAGTIRDLGRAALAQASGATPQHVRGLVVTRSQLEVSYARLASMTTSERMELPGVSSKRADLLPVGGVVLLAAMEAFGLDQLQLCDWGLREGALLDAIGDERVVGLGDFTHLGG